MFQKPERRRTLALYTLARLAQARYNSLKAAGRWHFWGSTWPHGDTLLFALSSAQVQGAERLLDHMTTSHCTLFRILMWSAKRADGPIAARDRCTSV